MNICLLNLFIALAPRLYPRKKSKIQAGFEKMEFDQLS